jgi:SAM-dependent methyltransferase
LAQQLYPQKYDLVLANNVLAHVPSPLDFVKGVKEVLSPRGRAIFEFHHVPNLIFGLQFDNFYHEHFSYFSLSSISPIFEEAGLRISSVKKVNTQGGSLRIVASNRVDRVEYGVWDLLKLEEEVGLNDLDLYRGYQNRIEYARYLLREKIFELLKEGHNIYGYGASAKSNTLLHFASIDSSLLSYIVDLSPQKIGRFTPGTNIPIISPEQEKEIGRPEYYLLTVWNYLEGVLKRETLFRERGGKFVVPLPEVRIV